MRIAIDYDGTYTEDPGLWDQFIAIAKERRHDVVCVTMRSGTDPTHAIEMPCEVIYTDSQAKARHYNAHVWIDDHPQWIYK